VSNWYGGPKPVPVAERLWAKVDKTETCWLWTGGRNASGYGRITESKRLESGRRWYTHRLVYTLLVGPIPDGMELDHLCRVRHCCNPEHLEPVTPGVNVARSEGPTADAVRAFLTGVCPRGHDVTGYGAMPLSGGRRRCRECLNEWKRRYRARLKQEVAS
jgi:hypothetical protein